MLNAAFATERPKPAPLPWMMAAAYPAESVRSPAGITAIAATQPDRLHSVMMQDPDAARTSAFELPAWNIPALVSSLNPAAPRARAPETDLYPLASIEPALPLATPALSRLLQQIEQPEAMSAGPEVHPPAQADTATSQPPVSPQLKQAVEDWQARPAARSDERKLRAAIVSFYTARNFAPLWSHNGQWSAQAHAALGRVERAGEDGLDLGTMPRPDLGPDAANLAENELMLTDLVAHYAAQAMGSRIDPLEISKLITAKPTEPDFADILNHVAAAEDAGSLLQGELVVHRYKAAQPGLYRAQATQVCLRQFSGTPAAGGHLLPRSLQGGRLNGKLHVAKRAHCSGWPENTPGGRTRQC